MEMKLVRKAAMKPAMNWGAIHHGSAAHCFLRPYGLSRWRLCVRREEDLVR